MLTKSNHRSKFTIDTFFAVITGIATVFLVFVAYFQLHDLNTIEGEKFLEEIKRDFFTPQANEAFLLFENDQLRFKLVTDSLRTKNTIAVFERNISPAFKPYLDSIGAKNRFYLSNQLDDYLFTNFEDLGKLYKRGIIDLPDIDQDFGYYISTCFENEQIARYIHWARSIYNDSTLYNNFEFLYKELEKKKHL